MSVDVNAAALRASSTFAPTTGVAVGTGIVSTPMVASAALGRFRFPLGGDTLSAKVTLIVRSPAVIKPLSHTTWTWNKKFGMHENNLFPATQRTMKLVLLVPAQPRTTLVVAAPFFRQWNGLGGFLYIPSFPQLERHVTAYPHAT